MMAEPDFQTEKELEHAVASAVQDMFLEAGVDAIVLRGFGLDLAVFTKMAGASSARFFEIKGFSEHHGRCGFGNQRGEGNQIRLLFDETKQVPRDQSQLGVFDLIMRWVLGNRSKPVGSPRFLLFTCMQAQNAAMNGVRPGKQNNLRLSDFHQQWMTWGQLLGGIKTFIGRAD
jgi:hypothetical protein